VEWTVQLNLAQGYIVAEQWGTYTLNEQFSFLRAILLSPYWKPGMPLLIKYPRLEINNIDSKDLEEIRDDLEAYPAADDRAVAPARGPAERRRRLRDAGRHLGPQGHLAVRHGSEGTRGVHYAGLPAAGFYGEAAWPANTGSTALFVCRVSPVTFDET